jgi:hypothetical protein
LVAHIPVPVLDLGYRFVARHRMRFGRLVPQRAKHDARRLRDERDGRPTEGGSCGLPTHG